MSKTFGPLVKELRLRAGFGLRRFAELIDMEPSNLSALEHSRRNPPVEPDRLKEIADALGLVEDSPEWGTFFNAARRKGELPADIRETAERTLVPTLLRTINNHQLDDKAISDLIADIEAHHGGAKHGAR